MGINWKPSTLLGNLENKYRPIVECVIERFPFIYIEDTAKNVYGKVVEGHFAVRTRKPGEEHGHVWAYFDELRAAREVA